MINFFATIILNFFDHFHKKKIVNKLSEINHNSSFNTVFDIGAHKGETLKFFLKNMRIGNVYSFEPSKSSFEILIRNSNILKKGIAILIFL